MKLTLGLIYQIILMAGLIAIFGPLSGVLIAIPFVFLVGWILGSHDY